MITQKQLLKLKRWYYSHITTCEEMIMSGWKLYIYGEDANDSFTIASLLLPIAKKYDFTMKVATPYIIETNSRKAEVAWSVGVIYLHADLFSEKKIGEMVDDIDNSLKEYTKKGVVNGAKSINGKLHYRYELAEPTDPAVGVEYGKYLLLYRGEIGPFNVEGNADIISLLNPKLWEP